MIVIRSRTGRLLAGLVVASSAIGLILYLGGVPVQEGRAGFDIDSVRQLVDVKQMQDFPLRLEMQMVVQRKLPYWLAGGSDCYNYRPVLTSFNIVYEDYYIMIDPGPDRHYYTSDIAGRSYDGQAALKIHARLSRARAIFFSQPGARTMALAARSSRIYHFRDQLQFTSAQLKHPQILQSHFPPAVLEVARRIDYNSMRVYAPGLVLLRPDPLHPERQWFYIKLRQGTELLLIDAGLPGMNCITNKRNANRLHLLLDRRVPYADGLLSYLARMNRIGKIKIVHGGDLYSLQLLQRKKLLIPML